MTTPEMIQWGQVNRCRGGVTSTAPASIEGSSSDASSVYQPLQPCVPSACLPLDGWPLAMPYKNPEVRRRKANEYTQQWRQRQRFDPVRFWQRVVKGDGCWIWTGRRSARGYGQWYLQGRGIAAHRVAYEAVVGPVPAGLVLDHLCRTHACVRPSHMEPVTQRENVLRGEGVAARQAAQTHCIHGHPFDATNTYLNRGKRVCRECMRQAGRRYRQRIKERALDE